MLNDVIPVELPAIPAEVWKLKMDGYRFVTMTCLDVGTAHEVIYHFDKNYQLKHLRATLPKGQVLPSITGVFFAAVLVENEIKDLFGVEFSGLVIDFKGRFILSDGAPVAPLNKATIGIGMEIRNKSAAAEGTVKS
jgi:Ni,Fe-hydrogenase III component G